MAASTDDCAISGHREVQYAKHLPQRELFGTHSLHKGAALALIEARWTVDDVKFVGRWLSAVLTIRSL